MVAHLEATGVERRLVEYLVDRPTRRELEELAGMLTDLVADLDRTGDGAFTPRRPDPVDFRTTAAVVGLLAELPGQLQRPVVIVDGRATIVRTPERLAALPT